MLEGYYMNALTQELVELLTLEKLEEHIFRGNSRNLVKRVFGGQVLGQALRAASYTTNRPAHSLHAYFFMVVMSMHRSFMKLIHCEMVKVLQVDKCVRSNMDVQFFRRWYLLPIQKKA